MKNFKTIAGYCRISLDEELDRDNTSIENQRAIISEYAKKKSPDCELVFYEDRDRSGYTFKQRKDYQKLRPRLMRGEIQILIIKDFSCFSRRNSKGLVELEDLRDAGGQIISIKTTLTIRPTTTGRPSSFVFLINEIADDGYEQKGEIGDPAAAERRQMDPCCSLRLYHHQQQNHGL